MSEQTYIASDIQGLTPAIDGRVSKKLFVLSGLNYRFDSRGPRSAFGSALMGPTPLAKPLGAQSFDVRALASTYTFLISADCIQIWDTAGNDWRIAMSLPDTSNNAWRWSRCFLDNTIFLCHPSVGIIYWMLRSNTMGFFRVAGAPSTPIAVAVNNGRLGIMDSTGLSWSAPYNGFDFTPQLGGAGIQVIAQHVSGAPFALTSYSKGFLTWTNDGVMRSEYTGDEAVYRHRPLNTKYRPVNSFCVAQMDDETTLLLDPRGLYSTSGDMPELFAPVFSEYLIEYLRLNNLRAGNNTRVEWDSTHQQLFISISHDYEGPFFSYAFVCQVNLDKWGILNHKHYGLGSMGEFDFGYIDDGGFPRRFVDDAQNDSPVGTELHDLVRSVTPGVAQQNVQNSSWVLGTNVRSCTRLLGPYVQSGLYASGSGNASTYPQMTLDSKVVLGYMRGFNLDSNDRLTEIVQIMVGSVEAVADRSNAIDANSLSGTLDMNLLVGGTDSGAHPLGVSNYTVSLTSTLDGTTEFVTESMTLARFTPAARYYSCTVPGLWHTLTLSATNVGERFHLRALEMTYVDGGKFL